MKYTLKCSQCNKEIKKYKKYDNNFCSLKCHGEYRKETCKTKILTKCAICSKEIKLKKSQYEKRNKRGRITCSYKCMGISKKTSQLKRNNPNCKYKSLPDDFFKKVDTEQKAYIVGFIASDGSLAKNGVISISIKNTDREILRKIRDTVCKEVPIVKIKNRNMIVLRFCSKTMVKDICRWLQIHPGKKDSKVRMPKIKNKLKWHFLRGFFDGDGTVRKKKEGRYIDCAIYTNSDKMREGIEKLCKIRCTNNNKWKYIGWYGDNARKFLKKLYSKADIYMERKYRNYLEW